MKIHFVVFICYFSNLRRGWYFKEEKVDLVKYYLGREVQIRQSGSSGNPFSKLKVSSFAKFSLPLGTAVFCLHLRNIRKIKLLTWICEQSWSEICDILASAFNILNICVIFDVRGVSLTCPAHFKLHVKKTFSQPVLLLRDFFYSAWCSKTFLDALASLDLKLSVSQ